MLERSPNPRTGGLSVGSCTLFAVVVHMGGAVVPFSDPSLESTLMERGEEGDDEGGVLLASLACEDGVKSCISPCGPLLPRECSVCGCT